MYVTRPLSMYRRSPSTLEIPPPEAPYSGYIVITDEEAEAEDTCCWNLYRRKNVKRMPFPQDKIYSITHPSEYEQNSSTKVWFLPVPDHSLSSNRYYVIRAKGRHKGDGIYPSLTERERDGTTTLVSKFEMLFRDGSAIPSLMLVKVYKSSREGDIVTCCFNNILNDKNPKPFNLKDLYQIFKIHTHQSGGFFAKSITPDGIPPKFLRKKGWRVRTSGSYRSCKLTEALGLDSSLREKLPDFNFPISRKRSLPLVIGKWYCPFIFVREEGRKIKHQMKKHLFYKMTLEQRWEEIYSCERVENGNDNVVNVNVYVEREVVLVYGMEATKSGKSDVNGFMWFRGYNGVNRRRVSVGLSNGIVENMRWVEEQGGWVYGNGRERVVSVKEEVTCEREWIRVGCYVLVESFCLRTLDGKLVLRYDFRHTHKIKCKWE